MRNLVGLFLMLTVLTAVASAQIDVKSYREALLHAGAEQRTLRTYVAGAGQGLATANAKLASTHHEVLFCPPETLPLNVDNMMSIIADWLKKMSNGNTQEQLDQLPVVTVLLEGLIDTFPCPAQRP